MTLATEQVPEEVPVTTSDAEPHAPLLETWSHNERMRHIPSLPWLTQKLEGDLRRRFDALWNVYARLPHDDPQHAALEKEFRALCRWIDRVADIARRARPGNHHHYQHPPSELGSRITWGIQHAVTNLNALDPETFGRRYPFQTFERSVAEPLWAAMLSVIEHAHRLTEQIRTIDRGIDERIYEGLVVLQTPLDARPMA